MSRLPKFRAWDIENKRYMTHLIEDVEESEVRLKLWGEVTFKEPWFTEHGYRGATTTLANDSFHIMEFTGVKDVNGLEVCEGDIVRYFTDTLAVIKYIEGAFVISRIDNSDFDTLIDRAGEIEVVGDIHKDPELLEVSEEMNLKASFKDLFEPMIRPFPVERLARLDELLFNITGELALNDRDLTTDLHTLERISRAILDFEKGASE